MTDIYCSETELSYAGRVLESEASARGCSIDEAAVKRADTVVLFGAGQGRIARRLAALNPRRLLVLEPVVAWAERAGTYLPPEARLFTNAPLLRHALIERADERAALIGTPEYTDAFPDQWRATIALIQECEMHKQTRKNTRTRRYNTAILAGLTNLSRVAEVPFWSDFGAQPMLGRPAVIVAAGPSLDRNRHLLQAARDRGAAIFAVNTSLPVVAAEGGADVVTVIEAIDSTEALAPYVESINLLALDIGTNSRHFDLTVRSKALFFPGVEPFTHLAAELGSRVLPYGSSVATAAFSLAFHWGCGPIVVVGQDLAYTGGRAYAQGLGPRSDVRAFDRRDHVELEYPAAHLERFDHAGAERPPDRQVRIELPAWGGQGSVLTTPDLLIFARWFEQAAVQIGVGGNAPINATEGGARLEGFVDMPFAEAIATFRPAPKPIAVPRPRYTPADVGRMHSTISRHVQRIRGAAVRRELDDLRERIMCSAFVDCLCAPDVSGLRGDEPDFADRLCEAVIEACDDVIDRVSC